MLLSPNIMTEKTSTVYNSGFMAFVDAEDIFQTDWYGNRTVVGKTIKAYSELQELANKYYEKLVELGVIPKERSPEEVAEENVRQLEQTKSTLEANQKLMAEMMDEMKKLKVAVQSIQDSETFLREPLENIKDVNYYLNEDVNYGSKYSGNVKESSADIGPSGQKTSAGTSNK